jgi:hypothetical protein
MNYVSRLSKEQQDQYAPRKDKNAIKVVIPFTPLNTDFSQSSTAAVLSLDQARKKRSRTAPHRSPHPKRSRKLRLKAQNPNLRRTYVQDWPVADLNDINLFDNGSTEIVVL